MTKQQQSQKRLGQGQSTIVKFLSFICVSGSYGLLALTLVQAYVLVSWLNQ